MPLVVELLFAFVVAFREFFGWGMGKCLLLNLF